MILFASNGLIYANSLDAKTIMDIIRGNHVVLYSPEDIISFDTIPQMHRDTLFFNAFDELYAMLRGDIEYDFKRATFIVENAYLKGELDYNEYCDTISTTINKLEQFIKLNHIDIRLQRMRHYIHILQNLVG